MNNAFMSYPSHKPKRAARRGVAVFLFLPAVLALEASVDRPEGPFQHRKHAALKLKCASCHTTAEKEDAAGFPDVARCKTCHTQIADRTIPSRRVYTLPGYVFFSHATHVNAKSECAACHGDVWQQEVMKVERPLRMPNCIACHKEHNASVACTVCHELGQ
jgi:hypothetical protein